MKLSRPIMLSLLFVSFQTINAQSKITEKFLVGTWDLNINIDEELRKVDDEARETESLFESVILSTVSGAISGIIDRIDISMEFEKNGEVKVIVDAFGEREIEYSEWFIDNRGRLRIDDTDHFSSDYSDYWVRDGSVIALLTDDEVEVYLTRAKN